MIVNSYFGLMVEPSIPKKIPNGINIVTINNHNPAGGQVIIIVYKLIKQIIDNNKHNLKIIKV